MTDPQNEMELEVLVRHALRARPLPPAPADLARRAATLGRAQETATVQRQIERLASRRTRNRVISTAAAALVAVVIFLGANRLQPIEDSTSSSQAISTGSTTTASAASQQTTINVALALTGEGLLVALVLLSAPGTLRPRPHLAAGYW